MKKRILFSCMLFLLCGHLFSQEHTDPKPCAGVLINGVCWAESNVDSPGTFAATPEAYGMFYQWNRRKGWPATGSVTGWDSSTPSGNSWDAANDPCPAGWRVPTKEEIATLLDDMKVNNEKISQNEVLGKKFTDKATGNAIFLPGASWREGHGLLQSTFDVCYWSGSSNPPIIVWALIDNGMSNLIGSFGLPVRCVANSNVPDCDSIVKNISETICTGDLPYTWGDTVFQAGTKTGKYRFQHISKVTGCDSIVYLNLTVRPEPHLSFSDAVCSGSGYTKNGFNLPVVFADTLVSDTLQTVEGCDSIRSLYLTVNPVYTIQFSGILCEGSSYTEHGFNVSQAGVYHRYLKTISGCDSIITLSLTEEKKLQDSIGLLLEDCTTHTYAFSFEPEIPLTSCQWDMGDGTILRSEKGIHTYADSGVYRIQLRAETLNGCENRFSYTQPVPHYLPEVQFQADRLIIDKDFPTVHFCAEVLPEMTCE